MTPQEAMQLVEDAFDDDRIDVYSRFPDNIKDDPSVFHKLLDVVQEYRCDALKVAGKQLKTNFEVCMRACLLDLENFTEVDKALKKDVKFVLPIVEAHKASLEFQDVDFVKQVVRDCPDSLSCLPSYQSNCDVALCGVRVNGAALAWCSKSLRSDSRLVRAALSNNGLALEFATNFQDDQAMTVLAVFQNGLALQFASPRLQRDGVVVRIATRQNFQALLFAQDLKHAFVSCDDLVEINPLNLEFCPNRSRKLVEKAVCLNGMALQHTGFFRFDSDIVAKAIAQDQRAQQFTMLNKGAINKQVLNKEVANREVSNKQVGLLLQLIDEGAIFRQVVNPEVPTEHVPIQQVGVLQLLLNKVTSLPTLDVFSGCFKWMHTHRQQQQKHYYNKGMVYFPSMGAPTANQDRASMTR
jgi:hypothetical protein